MLTITEFLQKYADIGAAKTNASASRLLLLSAAAGFFIAIGGAATNTAIFAVENPSIAKVVCGLLFPFGLIMVVMTSSELFTGNCLLPISVLNGKASAAGMVRNWVLVYIGNFIGAVLVAAACVCAGQMNLGGGALGAFAIKIAAGKCSLSFGNAVVLGILCNILVCVAVIVSTCAQSAGGKAAGAFCPIAFFVIAGFEHCVANMFYAPAGIFAASVERYACLAAESGVSVGCVTWGNFLLHNLIPVTIGNIIGGVGVGILFLTANRAK